MQLKIKKGLDIPIFGAPLLYKGKLEGSLACPKTVALNLHPFEGINFKLLVAKGDIVKIGTPLVENKAAHQFFVSPAAGTIVEVRRGLKRCLENIIIALGEEEREEENRGLALKEVSREEIVLFLLKSGVFPHIRQRPFDLVANPQIIPRDIFVSAVESLPFHPSAAMQVEGEEENFLIGLEVLKRLTSGKVHLVYAEKSALFADAPGVEKYSAIGPHPIGSPSTHIHLTKPILHAEDHVWTLSTTAVVTVGKMVSKGRYHTARILGVGGEGIKEAKRGFYKTRMGLPISALQESCLEGEGLTLISGSPLTGKKVGGEDYLHFYDSCFSAFPLNDKREFLHFFGLGKNKYSFHKAYYAGHSRKVSQKYHFTTQRHGEERPFIDGSIYDKVMPLKIPVTPLIKAILAEDFDLAINLGLLEITAEDFALATFICPSKIEMIEIVRQGLAKCVQEMGQEPGAELP